jgi:pimeloyl-ACP methyl ester carboxylesterase
MIVPPPDPTTDPPPLCGSVLVDPVKSNLLQGPAITSNEAAILNAAATTSPVFVSGVAADGVTQTMVAIPTQNLGDSVQLNLINDANSPSSSSDQDGGLAAIGGSISSLSNSVSLVADTTTILGPTAFAIYRAPTNYARGSQNFPQDNTSVQRGVSLQTICVVSGGSPSSPTNAAVTVVRPPVVLVHGLWADKSSWNNFAPTPNSPEAQMWSGLVPNVAIFPADYSAPVAVGSTVPAFANLFSQVPGSALGFEYNAPIVLGQIRNAVSSYASYFQVAAVQADVIAHSMGGDVTRTMALANEPWTFLTNDTYGQGPIEKLIAIGTPHLGSPLATDLLPTTSGDPNSCVRNFLAFKNDISLQTATISGTTWTGGVGDLIGDGVDANLGSTSQTLVALYVAFASGSQPFPMAYLAGVEGTANLADLNCSACSAAAIRFACGGLPLNDPLANDLTTNGWPNVFGGSANDGVVPLTSQLNGAATGGTPGGGGPVANIIHSDSLSQLDFIGFSELNSGSMAAYAVDLLNEAKNGPDFQH